MNTTQLKQYWQNNLWHGENYRRHDVDTPKITATLIQPDYKRVWGIDISHWDGVVDLAVTKALGASFVFIKGIDGTLRTKYFPENHAKAVQVGLLQAPYAWLYRNVNVSCTAQAQALDSLINQYPPTLPCVVDFETTYWGGAPSSPNFDDLRKWVTEFLRLGNPKPLLYSGKYFMNQYGQIPNDIKDMFAGLWIANYGVSTPNLPLGWTAWDFWQFTSSGDARLIAPGSTGKLELDLNYAYNLIPAPPPVVIVDGYQKLRRNNSDVHLWRGKPSKVHVTDNEGALIRPSNYYMPDRPTIIINGDGWDKTAGITYRKPLSLAASDGVKTQTEQFDFRPFFNASANNQFTITHLQISAYNQVSGTRSLVKDGVNFFATSTNPEYVSELHPRTAIGYTQDGKLIACVVDGRSSTSAGDTLKRLADIMIEVGAWYALELDGGDSSILLYNGVKMSANGDPVNGVRIERATVNSVLIYADEPTEGASMYEVTSSTNDMKLRDEHNTGGVSTIVIPKNTVMQADYIWTATVDLWKVINGVNKQINAISDKWAHVIKVGTAVYDKWVAVTHLGVEYCTVKDLNPPPATGKVGAIQIDAAAGTVVTVKDTTGATLWTGTA